MYPKCMLGHFLSSSVRETGTPMGTKRQNNVHNIEITLDERLNNVVCQLGTVDNIGHLLNRLKDGMSQFYAPLY